MAIISISEFVTVSVSEATADFCLISPDAVAKWNELEAERAELCKVDDIWNIPWCEDYSDFAYYMQAMEVSSTYENMDIWLYDKYGTWDYLEYIERLGF